MSNELQRSAEPRLGSREDMPFMARLTVVGHVYHQQRDSSPVASDIQFESNLDTDEQPYVRNAKVGEQWEKLDYGWIKEASYILLKNDEGKLGFVNPTEMEKQDVLGRIVEISFNGQDPDILIHPMESLPFRAADINRVWIRSRKDRARIVINIYPR